MNGEQEVKPVDATVLIGAKLVLARIIAHAAQIREQSFDSQHGDYLVSVRDAVEQATAHFGPEARALTYPAYAMIQLNGSEALNWCERVGKGEA